MMSSGLPPIRVVHHWACSGGTIISRSLAQLPRVVLLSEVHPLAHLRLHPPSSGYQPTDVVQQLSLARNGRDPALCIAAWRDRSGAGSDASRTSADSREPFPHRFLLEGWQQRNRWWST